MNTIVVNTLTAAVSEYSGYSFNGVTEDYVGNSNGLYQLGGDLDIDQAIAAEVQTGKTDWGSANKKMVDIVFLGIKGAGTVKLNVVGENTSYEYNFAINKDGESRCLTGRGIRENYLAFGIKNTNGGAFQLDRIEVDVGLSKIRRTR